METDQPAERAQPRDAPDLGTGPDEPNLRQATLDGVKWMGGARLIAESAAFGSVLVLARLVPPAEFGRAAVTFFVFKLAQSLTMQGIGSFLVQRRDLTERHYRAAVTTSWATGVVGALLSYFVAKELAPSIFGDRIAELLVLVSPVFVFYGLAAVPIARLQRNLDFARLGKIEAVASVGGPIVAVSSALAGLDGESIVLGSLATSAITTMLALIMGDWKRPGWCPAETREMVRFGTPAMGSGLLYTVLRNVDYAILAARLPAAQVGYYVRAFQLGTDYQAKISTILLRVAFPVFSRSKSFDEMRRMRARIIRLHATVLFPLLFGLIAVAPVFVPFAFGEVWRPAAELTQILAIGGLVSAVGTGTGPLLMAAGRPGALFVYNLVAVIAFTAAVFAAVPYGVVAVCWAVVAVRFVTFIALQYLVVERVVGIPILETARDDVLPATVGGLALLGSTTLVLELLDGSLGAPLLLLLAGTVGLAAYGLVIRVLFRGAWGDLALLGSLLAPRLPRFMPRRVG